MLLSIILKKAATGIVLQKKVFFIILQKNHLCWSLLNKVADYSQFLHCLSCCLFIQENVQTSIHRCFSKPVFFKVSQYLQENTCVGVSKAAGLKAFSFIKQKVDDDLSVCMLNILPEANSLTSLLAINLIKVEIQIF